MAKITDNIKFHEKMSKLASMQYDLIKPSLLHYSDTLYKMNATAIQMVKTSIPTNLQILIDKMNEMQRLYQPIVDFELFQINEFMPKFNILLDNLSAALGEINLEECSEEQKEFLTSTDTQINELNNTLTSPKQKTLTWEQWLNIILFIISLIALIKDFLPDEQIEHLTTEVQTISNSFEDYAQKDLANQRLLLEKEDIQIENQEKILETLEKNQCDCKTPD